MICPDVVLAAFLIVLSVGIQGYLREEVQKLYPEYGTDYVLFPDEDGDPMIGYLKMENRSKSLLTPDADLDGQVKFEYFSRKYPEGIRINSKSELKYLVNTSKPTKCVTHGWMSGGRRDSSVFIRKGFLHRYDANVLVMDWSAISGNVFYPVPMMQTPEVGRHYGSYLNYLVDELEVKPEDVHLVGHSLGAHLSGFAAREVSKGKIGRITGLDPALPGFDIGLVSSGTLSVSDATFVDVIHTCAGFLGYKFPIGHADFYPNGGCPPQPGCNILKFMEACSHGRSWKIFTNSLISDQPYLALKCSSLGDVFGRGQCVGDSVPIGDPTPWHTRGIFFSEISEEEVVFNVFDNKV